MGHYLLYSYTTLLARNVFASTPVWAVFQRIFHIRFQFSIVAYSSLQIKIRLGLFSIIVLMNEQLRLVRIDERSFLSLH